MRGLGRMFAACLLATLAVPSSMWGQIIIGQPGVPVPPKVEPTRNATVFPTLKGRRVDALEEAKALIKFKRYDKAIEYLQRVLQDERWHPDDQGDFFVKPNPENPTSSQGLKAEVMRAIAALPEDAKKVYEQTYGLEAKKLVQKAMTEGEIDALREVVRLYLHTEAGATAVYLLGSFHLDMSEPVAASRYFELARLTGKHKQFEPLISLKTAVAYAKNNHTEKARGVLVSLKTTVNGMPLKVGGAKIEWFADGKNALTWLDNLLGRLRKGGAFGLQNWVMFRGTAARNVVSRPASLPWNPSWKYDTLRIESWIEGDALLHEDTTYYKEKIPQIRKTMADVLKKKEGTAFLKTPMQQPLVTDQWILCPGFGGVIIGLNRKTGEFEWETTFQDHWVLNRILSSANPIMVGGGYNPYGGGQYETESALQRYTKQRAFRDLTTNAMSTDGSFVYAVMSNDLVGPMNNQYAFGRPGVPQSPFAPKRANELVCYSIGAQGKIVWEIGGEEGEGEKLLAGHYFLGPPLPLDGHLYCVAELDGEVRLVCLKVTPRPGNLADVKKIWSQPLVEPQSDLQFTPARKLAGLSPSYADGVLVCPTSGGGVVAVDIARRMLLWGYRYDSKYKGMQGGGRRIPYRSAPVQMDDDGRWIDSNPTIADGRVILTPRDSAAIHCLDLSNGKLLWSHPRNDGLYVGGVDDGKVYVVGRSTVIAYDLDSGKPAWPEAIPIPEPTGRGYLTSGYYHVPLRSKEIATIDLKKGVLQSRSPFGGGTPGNLVAVDGMLISQTWDSVSGFSSLAQIQEKIAERIKVDPNDPQALAWMGELQLRRGETTEGLQTLKKALAIKPNKQAQSLYVERLLEGLRRDFSGYQKHADEIKKHATSNTQKTRFHRLYAAGLQKTGKTRDAFRSYLALAGLNKKPELQKLDALRSVRSDRWVRARLENLQKEASADARKEMRAEVQAELQAAIADGDPIKLRQLISSFGDLSIADDCREALVGKLDPKVQAMELSFLLERLRTSSNADRAGFATARLADLLIANGQGHVATELLDKLESKYGDIVCLDGKTGKELVKAWRADSKVSPAIAPGGVWGKGKFTVAEKPRGGVNRSIYPYPVKWAGPSGKIFRGWTFTYVSRYDQQRRRSVQEIIAFNARGKEAFRFSMTGDPNSLNFRYFTQNLMRVRGFDHLLVFDCGADFAVFDTLSLQSSNGTLRPKLLWKGQLVESPTNGQKRLYLNLRQIIKPNGMREYDPRDWMNRRVGLVGPVNGDYLCYQYGETVRVADPTTGETMWERKGFERGSRLFGDYKHVIVMPPEGKQLTILRAIDGEQVASNNISSLPKIITTRGRYLVGWTKSGAEGSRLIAYDPIAKKEVWSVKANSSAMQAQVDSDHMGFLDTAGQFVVVNLDEGKKIIDAKIDRPKTLQGIVVRRTAGRFTLLTLTPDKKNRNWYPTIYYQHPKVNGPIWSFDSKTGKLAWKRTVEAQALDPTVPADLPIMCFASRVQKWENVNGRRRSRYSYNILVLDMRNGRTVFDKQSTSYYYQRYHLTADVEKKEIKMQFQNGPSATFTLTKDAIEKPVMDLKFGVSKPEKKAEKPANPGKPVIRPPIGPPVIRPLPQPLPIKRPAVKPVPRQKIKPAPQRPAKPAPRPLPNQKQKR